MLWRLASLPRYSTMLTGSMLYTCTLLKNGMSPLPTTHLPATYARLCTCGPILEVHILMNLENATLTVLLPRSPNRSLYIVVLILEEKLCPAPRCPELWVLWQQYRMQNALPLLLPHMGTLAYSWEA